MLKKFEDQIRILRGLKGSFDPQYFRRIVHFVKYCYGEIAMLLLLLLHYVNILL